MGSEAGNPLRDEFRFLLRQSRAKKIRTMHDFAVQEIVIPDGIFAGQRFKTSTQPFAGLWLDAVDSGRWPIVNTTGPSQTGKTLLASGIPLIYHLFEIGETVIFGLPDMDMASDKWEQDLLPMICATRFVELLPTTGEGSRGGKVKNAVTFKNGATLKFMTGGASGIASDKGRAGFTARVLIITEKNAFGTSGESSEESNKLEQLRARTLHYGSLARIYEECTVETELCPVWTDYKAGTESRIVGECPHCGQWVAPEREHLRGWQDAQNVIEAKAKAHFVCPTCEKLITEDERRVMNEQAVLVHRGQTVAAVEEVETGSGAEAVPLLVGEAPATDTLGFRWSAFNNLFRTAGDVGVDEWKSARAVNEDDAERKMCQFIWCLPYQTQVEKITPLTKEGIIHRLAKTPKGLVPAETQFFTVAIDWGQSARTAWWVAIAWLPEGSSVVVDYGHIDVLSDTLGVERALELAEREFREMCEKGWTWEGHPYARRPDATFEDVGWQDKIIYAGIRAANSVESSRDRYWPSKGFGSNQYAGQSYTSPKKTGSMVRLIGEDYHLAAMPAERVHLVEFNADTWKLFAQARLMCRLDEPGAMRLFSTVPSEHTRFARHILAEQVQIEFVPDKGEVRKFKKKGPNHLLDAVVNASIAGHFVGVRVTEPPRPQHQVEQPPAMSPAVRTPDGQPYSILER